MLRRIFYRGPVRERAIALYAFCRLADDAIDCSADPAAALPALHDRLDRIYAQQPLAFPADRAMAGLVIRFGIPRDLLLALLEGFAWDAAGRRYETIDDVTAYAVRVAGSVGVLMALIMDRRDPDTLARACDLGVAMQFSNIARDVGEDARNGRLYLPAGWMRDAGIEPQSWLAQPVFTPAIGQVVQRLLAEAATLYARADSGIAALPRACRPGIRAARSLYAGIGDQVARAGFNSVNARARVSSGKKLHVVARGLVRRAQAADLCAPILPSAAHLIHAVQAVPARNDRSVPSRNLEARVTWTIELFQRLAERDAVRLISS